MKPTVAVLGCGRWGPKLVRNFIEAGCSVWVADPHEDRIRALCERFPGVRTASTEQLLTGATVCAIALATPASTHAALAATALDHGKHVLVEKPMAATASQASALVDQARRANRVLAIDHTALFEAPTHTLLQLAPSLGRPRRFESERLGAAPNRTDTDVLGDLAPHDLAVLFRWRPAPIDSVQATGSLRDGVLAQATLQLRAPDFDATLKLSWTHSERRRTLRLSGAYRSLTPPAAEGPEPLRALVDDFLDAIHTGSEPRCPGSTAIPIAAVIDAARRSMREGGRRVQIRTPG